MQTPPDTELRDSRRRAPTTAPAGPGRTGRRRRPLVAVALLAVLALTASACGDSSPSSAPSRHRTTSTHVPRATPGSISSSTTAPTTGTAPTTVGDTPTVTTALPTGTTPPTSGSTPPLATPGPGFVAGHVTAVGDSVMLDYQTALEQDVPGIDVEAAVSRQWATGETLLQQAKTAGQLGAIVVVALGTNGPITTTDFNSMMSILSGASRVIFVNTYVDRTWQDSNNAVLAAGVSRYPNTVLVDWHALASKNSGWLYSTGTHLPINGPGAQALASLVAGKT